MKTGKRGAPLRVLCWLPAAILLLPGPAGAGTAAPAPPAPPGFHVHLVLTEGGRRFWRGGAPRKETLQALAASGKERGVPVTLLDLRRPPTADDRSGKGGRLSPAAAEAEARRLGIDYLSVSALDRNLLPRLERALKRGDVYMHCMYGVNRTGFATARFARARRVQVAETGLGARDWKQGTAFEERLQQEGGRSKPAKEPVSGARKL